MLDTTRRVATPEGIELTLHLAGPLPRAMAWAMDLAMRIGIVLAVLPFHRLAALGVDGRTGEEGVVRAGVEKDHRPVFGVDALFHGAGPGQAASEKARIIRFFFEKRRF